MNNAFVLKHAGGCSLWQQVLDLTKCFMLWRAAVCKAPPGGNIPFHRMPPLGQLVWNIITKHGMDKASVELFVNNYFLRIPTAFAEAFKMSHIMSGWARSGIYPFDQDVLLRNTPMFYGVTKEIADEVFKIVSELAIDTSRTGICDEVKMRSMLEPLGFISPVQDMSSRCLIQQRALVLTMAAAIAMRRDLLDKHESKLAESLAAKNAAIEKKRLSEITKKEKAERELVVASLSGDDGGKVGLPLPGSHCSNPTCQSSHIGGGGSAAEKPLEWRGCNTCPMWFCNKTACRNTMRKKHDIICRARAIIAAPNVNG